MCCSVGGASGRPSKPPQLAINSRPVPASSARDLGGFEQAMDELDAALGGRAPLAERPQRR